MNNTIPVFILNELIILPGQEIKIDLTNEGSKKVIKSASKSGLNKVLVIAPKNPLESSPSFEDLPQVGVIAKIKSKVELNNGSLRIVLRGESRVKIEKYYQNRETGVIKCSYMVINLPSFDISKETAIRRKLIKLVKKYIEENKSVTNSIINTIDEITDLNVITDIITSFLPLSFGKKLEYMEIINPLTRATNLIEDLNNEINILNIDKELDEKLQTNLENSQREYILKEKLREINEQLGNTKEEEVNDYIEKLDSLNLSEYSYKKIFNEIRKYESTSDYSPESAIIKNYLDTVINLPWNKESIQNEDITDIKSKLEESHYGLSEIKNRIVEYVASKKVSDTLKAPIICLVGPPGVGKTSIAMSIAKCLNREFFKVSVGGLNDSTELTGSRRTYLGAIPGKIMQAIIKCNVNNPLILIDEVDKMVKDYKGDPASTMLEILDETQNKLFVDNYIEEPFDLSKVMFILTANNIDDIPKTLSDRLEIIEVNSYSIYEKIDIAKNYLLKSIFSDYNCELRVNKDVLEYIVMGYTKEPGVRELKRILEKLVRKIIVYEKDSKSITINLVNKYLGQKMQNILPRIRNYGISNTLAYTTLGGQVSHVEVSKIKGNGKITITGSCGDVLIESVKVVASFLGAEYNCKVNDYDIHVHFMSASQKKEGPSAGISIAVAMLSCFKDRLIPANAAFTGEITLKGDVLPVGGLKEKLISASSAGIKTVFIPKANEQDLETVPLNILDNLDVKMIENFSEVYDALF